MKTTHRRGTPDFILIVLTFLLVGFGIVMVFSASSATSAYFYNDSLYYTKRQLLFAIVGIIALFVLMNIPYNKLRPFIFPSIIVLVALLILVLMRDPTYGARSWIKIGSFGIQPSEFAKLGIIMYLSHLIAKKQDKIRDFQKGLLPVLIVTGLVAGLIMMQPDYGTTAIFLCCALAVIITGGVNLKHLISIVFISGSFIALFISIHLHFSNKLKYIQTRFTSFMDPWQDPYNTGYNLIHSYFAFGHGGTFGAGIGQSIEKLHYLPLPHNDFIFPVIGEELGFVGSTIFLLVYIVFLWRVLMIGLRCKDLFGLLFSVGIVTMFGIQTIINIGGVTGSIPITGVPIPFISYGGSSLLVSMISIGVLLSISRENNRLEKEKVTA